MKKAICLALMLCLGILIFLPFQDIFADSHTSKMIEHTLNQNVFVRLPASMEIMENPLGDRNQLLYSVSMNDEDLLLRGYIQVWQLEDVEKFLSNNREISSYDFYSYSLNKVTVGNLSGQLNAWGASFGELTKISGKEYWLRNPDSSEVLRVAFLTSKSTFSKDQDLIVNQILSTLRWEFQLI